MRFLISVIDSQSRSPHSATEIQAIDDFNEYLENQGYRKFAIGLESPDEAKLFDNRKGKASASNGPLIDATEFISGIWLIDVPNRRIAEELATQASSACNRRVELRPVID